MAGLLMQASPAAGHSFILFLDNGFPVNVLNQVCVAAGCGTLFLASYLPLCNLSVAQRLVHPLQIKGAPTVCRIYCATANPTAVLIAKRGPEQRGIAGELGGTEL